MGSEPGCDRKYLPEMHLRLKERALRRLEATTGSSCGRGHQDLTERAGNRRNLKIVTDVFTEMLLESPQAQVSRISQPWRPGA